MSQRNRRGRVGAEGVSSLGGRPGRGTSAGDLDLASNVRSPGWSQHHTANPVNSPCGTTGEKARLCPGRRHLPARRPEPHWTLAGLRAGGRRPVSSIPTPRAAPPAACGLCSALRGRRWEGTADAPQRRCDRCALLLGVCRTLSQPSKQASTLRAYLLLANRHPFWKKARYEGANISSAA